MKKNIKLTIEYDGSKFHGWQEQKNIITIQGSIKQALIDLTKEKIVVHGSGRTDAGVHAYAQIANFQTESKIPDFAFAHILNTKLPDGISILKAQEVPLEFHARFSAKAKAYSYHIVNRKVRPAIERKYKHWMWKDLDIEKMRKTASFLVGTHDFSSFEAANSPRDSNIRTVNYIDIESQSCYIKILIEANGFLYKMVRNIVGTLIQIASSKQNPSYIKKILDSKSRKFAGPTAPASGLFLEYVKY